MNDSLDHLRRTHARFNRGAACYDRLAGVQREAAGFLIRQLGDLIEPYRILEAGCGSGQLTQQLLDRFRASRVDAFDLSETMLEIAAETIPDTRVRWIHADFAQFTSALPYPLVISSSSLHWAPSLSEAVHNLATRLAPGGVLAISIMIDGTLRELHACRGIAAPNKPVRRPMPVPADAELAVDEKGLVRTAGGVYEIKVRHDSALGFLRCLREQGLTGGQYFRPVTPLTPREVAALADAYEQLFPDPEGGVTATYAIGWLLARRRD